MKCKSCGFEIDQQSSYYFKGDYYCEDCIECVRQAPFMIGSENVSCDSCCRVIERKCSFSQKGNTYCEPCFDAVLENKC